MENETEAVKMINKINRDFNCNKIEIQIIPFLWLHHVACRILVPRPEMEPVPLALETQSQTLAHRESLMQLF